MRGGTADIRAIAAFVLLAMTFGDIAAAAEKPRTDFALVAAVDEPMPESNKIHATITATRPGKKKRNYYLFYPGKRILPAVGARCSISYRTTSMGPSDAPRQSRARLLGNTLRGRLVDSFACDDGRRWPDGTPPTR